MPANPGDAFDRFVAARGPALWQLAWLLTGAPDRADELLEQAFARVLPRWPELDRGGSAGVASPEAVVRRELIAVYLARPGAPPQAPRPLPDPAGPGAGAGAEPDILADAGDGTLERRCRDLLAVLATLPPRQRAAAVLHHGAGVAEWEAADALDVSSDELAALVASAGQQGRRSTARANGLLAGLADVVPDGAPDAASDQGRVRRVRSRAAATRRRRSLGYAAAVGVLVALVALPVLLTDPASSDPASSDPASPAASAPGATGGPTGASLPLAQRLVDPLPIPDRCATVADVPDSPDYAYELFGADVVWLRFCPATDTSGALDALDFAPDDTVVDREVDRLVDSWATPGSGPAACHPTGGIHDSLIRMQAGTLDGSLHVVDMRVGCTGKVSVDGQAGAADSRTAFTQAVSLLGAERLAEVEEPGVVRPAAVFCPAGADGVLDFERTTVSDYPQVPGLSVPLPAVSALVCRYDGGQPAGPGPRGVVLGRPAAETLRAAYLSRSDQPMSLRCRPALGTAEYGVVLSDATGSHRAFVAEVGPCGSVRGPGGSEGPAGPWLAEVLASSARP